MEDIEQLKQELINKIYELLMQYPTCAWLQRAVDMQELNNTGAGTKSLLYTLSIITEIGQTHEGRFN